MTELFPTQGTGRISSYINDIVNITDSSTSAYHLIEPSMVYSAEKETRRVIRLAFAMGDYFDPNVDDTKANPVRKAFAIETDALLASMANNMVPGNTQVIGEILDGFLHPAESDGKATEANKQSV